MVSGSLYNSNPPYNGPWYAYSNHQIPLARLPHRHLPQRLLQHLPRRLPLNPPLPPLTPPPPPPLLPPLPSSATRMPTMVPISAMTTGPRLTPSRHPLPLTGLRHPLLPPPTGPPAPPGLLPLPPRRQPPRPPPTPLALARLPARAPSAPKAPRSSTLRAKKSSSKAPTSADGLYSKTGCAAFPTTLATATASLSGPWNPALVKRRPRN